MSEGQEQKRGPKINKWGALLILAVISLIMYASTYYQIANFGAQGR